MYKTGISIKNKRGISCSFLSLYFFPVIKYLQYQFFHLYFSQTSSEELDVFMLCHETTFDNLTDYCCYYNSHHSRFLRHLTLWTIFAVNYQFLLEKSCLINFYDLLVVEIRIRE